MSNPSTGKNDVAWVALFEKYNILQEINKNNFFNISADKIKEFREPRLMAKFDHKINLPQIFLDNSLSILPISRGNYCISHFKTYKDFEPSEQTIIHATLPGHLQSISPSNITSESISINCALASGIFADFSGDTELFPTVSGRMSSGFFDFQISNCRGNSKLSLSVSNAQIEIDAALEGIDSLLLVEAKHDISSDFIIRQLFYPLRTWTPKITKKIRPIFLVYSNSIFSMYEYEFVDINDYNSIRLVQNKNYSIEETNIEISDVEAIVRNIATHSEPEVPFPQADSFERIINLCELLFERNLTREEVTQKYEFDTRQTNYYTDAGRYLGLIEKKYEDRKPVYALTAKGRRIIGLSYKPRQLALCECILQHCVFFDVFKECLLSGSMPDRNRVILLMKQAKLYNIEGDSTYYRRSSSILSWLNWIIRLWSL